MIDVQEMLQGQCIQCTAFYSAVLSTIGELYIWVDVSYIQQQIWIYFRQKLRDDTHPFASSTRLAQAATIHLRGSVHNGIVVLIKCLGTTRAHIQQDSEYIPWGNTVTLTKIDAIFSINKVMATYT